MSGEQAKEAGIAQALSSAPSAPWRVVARAGLLELVGRGRPFTSEDLTALVGQPPSPNAVGAVVNGAARAGWIERAGFVKAERANQHAALISRWQPTLEGLQAAEAAPPFAAPRKLVQEVLPW